MDKHYSISGQKGTYVAAGDQVVSIGQTEGCRVRVVNRTQYADETFAKIIPNSDKDGWRLVKTTTHWPVLVNGVEMNRVHYLQDNDALEFPNAAFRFNVLPGERKEAAVIHVHSHGRLIWGVVAALALVAAVVGWRIYDTSRENLTASMQEEIEASLFTLRVDSLRLMKGDSVIDSYAYASPPAGTAFLTADSSLVTARHCLEPWLNQLMPYEYSSIPSVSDWPVATALYAETENQLLGEDLFRICSFITLTDEGGGSFSMTSDSFRVNRELDEIVELGSYSSPRYWRSISHRYSRQSMMLGDIACARLDRPGLIPAASASDLSKLLGHKGTRLYFFGHPESAVGGTSLDRRSDELRLPLTEADDAPGRIFMLAHGGDLTPGFSGGPVIVRDGIGFKAVGVISVVDEKNHTRSYSVPTSEIER